MWSDLKIDFVPKKIGILALERRLGSVAKLVEKVRRRQDPAS
jgi:hypothetical protein